MRRSLIYISRIFVDSLSTRQIKAIDGSLALSVGLKWSSCCNERCSAAWRTQSLRHDRNNLKEWINAKLLLVGAAGAGFLPGYHVHLSASGDE
jgi:hypothetical protein